MKLEFWKDDLDGQLVKVICQTVFEGAAANGKPFTPSCVLYSDVPRGKVYTRARQGGTHEV